VGRPILAAAAFQAARDEKSSFTRHHPVMRHYQRRLPHWDAVGQPLFVTFRLQDSLPAHRVFPPDNLAHSGRAFVAMDRLLDRSDTGPTCLRRGEIAEMVVAALRDGDQKLGRYRLHAFVVMPNHVHMLVTPAVSSAQWLAPLNGFTAFRANQLLARRGHAFWQDESYDHLIRSEAEFERVRHYIEQNPVTAGLIAEAAQWPWSSAASRLKGGCGQDWPPHTSDQKL
jgi:REP element-mobilizing transposase RayT